MQRDKHDTKQAARSTKRLQGHAILPLRKMMNTINCEMMKIKIKVTVMGKLNKH